MKNPKLLRTAIFCFVIVLVGVSFMGCAGIDTPQKQLLVADQTFTSNLERYNRFHNLQTVELQDKLTNNIDPLWEAGDNALDAWAVAINKGMPPEEKIEVFRAIKDQLFLLLIKYGFKMED